MPTRRLREEMRAAESGSWSSRISLNWPTFALFKLSLIELLEADASVNSTAFDELTRESRRWSASGLGNMPNIMRGALLVVVKDVAHVTKTKVTILHIFSAVVRDLSFVLCCEGFWDVATESVNMTTPQIDEEKRCSPRKKLEEAKMRDAEASDLLDTAKDEVEVFSKSFVRNILRTLG